MTDKEKANQLRYHLGEAHALAQSLGKAGYQIQSANAPSPGYVGFYGLSHQIAPPVVRIWKTEVNNL